MTHTPTNIGIGNTHTYKPGFSIRINLGLLHTSHTVVKCKIYATLKKVIMQTQNEITNLSVGARGGGWGWVPRDLYLSRHDDPPGLMRCSLREAVLYAEESCEPHMTRFVLKI